MNVGTVSPNAKNPIHLNQSLKVLATLFGAITSAIAA